MFICIYIDMYICISYMYQTAPASAPSALWGNGYAPSTPECWKGLVHVKRMVQNVDF